MASGGITSEPGFGSWAGTLSDNGRLVGISFIFLSLSPKLEKAHLGWLRSLPLLMSAVATGCGLGPVMSGYDARCQLVVDPLSPSALTGPVFST